MFSGVFVSLGIKRIVPLLYHENIRDVVIKQMVLTCTSCKKEWGKDKTFVIYGVKRLIWQFFTCTKKSNLFYEHFLHEAEQLLC